ncbi:hypothetical protein BAE44_0008549 [Dichanthelium oligosanthes]|uniref:F-box domain-containing protein n=1 Tax=Dichanthelium oligosanthes TaxID=888268 RepID=A0A1E5VZ95_9POAL|nr:hypothetical protein BAE44_0008549 [Dichanthelium oligosanthes]
MEGAEGSEADDAGGREPDSAASRLTDDLILQILSQLPARSLHRFRCVSRHWRDHICSPDNRRRMAQTFAGFFYIGWTCDDNNILSDKFLHFASVRANNGGEGPVIDPSALSFPPGYHARLYRIDSCNNHLLIRTWDPVVRFATNYAVCNPATDELSPLPDSPTLSERCTTARLLFDPPSAGASSSSSRRSYRIFEFQCDDVGSYRCPDVWIYSTETRAWTYKQCGWAHDGDPVTLADDTSGVYHRGMLHLCPKEPVIASVDRDGNKWITTPKPADPGDDGFLGGPPPGHIGVSQGRVQFLNTPEYNHLKMCVWERDKGRWVPKHSIDLRELFVTWDSRLGLNCRLLGVNPDRGMVYFLQGQHNKLASYDTERGEGRIICELGFNNYTPYVAYSPSFALSFARTLREDQ